MKKIAIGVVIGVGIGLVIGFVIPLIIPPTQTPETTETHIYIDGKIVVGGDGEPIELINNPDATDPTYAELLAFLETDQTDKFVYIIGPPKNAYVCADFARDVHNNAEAAGIRAAWVGIDIEGEAEGHAINAFETTDIGLVYIDCTGKGLWDESSNCNSWDRRAYVEIGESYGVADIDKAKIRLHFYITEPIGSDQPGYPEYELEEQTLGSLEALGWIRLDTYEERVQKSHELLEWLRTHDITVLGQGWMQEWIQEHEAELSTCGQEFIPVGYYMASSSSGYGSGFYVSSEDWYIAVDCLETPWFQPEEELREVDGVPIVWKVWRENMWIRGWHERLGIVKDIYMHW
jgi:hypothetical protein